MRTQEEGGGRRRKEEEGRGKTLCGSPRVVWFSTRETCSEELLLIFKNDSREEAIFSFLRTHLIKSKKQCFTFAYSHTEGPPSP